MMFGWKPAATSLFGSTIDSSTKAASFPWRAVSRSGPIVADRPCGLEGMTAGAAGGREDLLARSRIALARVDRLRGLRRERAFHGLRRWAHDRGGAAAGNEDGEPGEDSRRRRQRSASVAKHNGLDHDIPHQTGGEDVVRRVVDEERGRECRREREWQAPAGRAVRRSGAAGRRGAPVRGGRPRRPLRCRPAVRRVPRRARGGRAGRRKAPRAGVERARQVTLRAR